MFIGVESFDMTFWLSIYGCRTSGIMTVPFCIQLSSVGLHNATDINFTPSALITPQHQQHALDIKQPYATTYIEDTDNVTTTLLPHNDLSYYQCYYCLLVKSHGTPLCRNTNSKVVVVMYSSGGHYLNLSKSLSRTYKYLQL